MVIEIIHCFIANYCQNGTKSTELSKCDQKLQLSSALLQFTVRTILKTFNFQMLLEITIIHCFIAIDCQNGT